ncbi:MAG: DUF3592 domain-containing protein [Limisphaerales bacterium]
MFATLFTSACITVGVLMLFGVLGVSIHGWWRTRSEVTVEAAVQSVSVKPGGKRATLLVQYTYVFDGHEYTGSRVTLFRHSMDFHEQLRDAYDLRRPVSVFIDPAEPRFAVIDRKFTGLPFALGLVMGSVFLTLGIYLARILYLERKVRMTTVRTSANNPA